MRNLDIYFLNLAKNVAQLSKDPSRKTGAIIVDCDNEIVSTGYNGLPRNFSKDHSSDYWERPKKYDYVVHAETNAIINAGRKGRTTINTTMYATFFPCHRCATNIINAGIKRIVTPIIQQAMDKHWFESINMAQEMFADCDVKMVLINI